MSQRRQAIIVLGMHRSGTSAVAGALAQLGFRQPRTLFPPSPDNASGYFESMQIVAANHSILALAGCAWTTCLTFDAARIRETFVPHADQVLLDLLRQEFGEAAPFVLKDPRLCVTWPLWRPALDLFGAEPRFLITVRHPAEVCRSLAARDALPEDDAAPLWLHHLLEAERATRGCNRAVVLYEDLLADWRTTIARAGQAAGIDWPSGLDEAGPAVVRFLSPTLRHHRAERSGAGLGPPIIDRLVATTWAALGQLAQAAEHQAALAALDHAHAAFARWRAERRSEAA